MRRLGITISNKKRRYCPAKHTGARPKDFDYVKLIDRLNRMARNPGYSNG